MHSWIFIAVGGGVELDWADTDYEEGVLLYNERLQIQSRVINLIVRVEKAEEFYLNVQCPKARAGARQSVVQMS